MTDHSALLSLFGVSANVNSTLIRLQTLLAEFKANPWKKMHAHQLDIESIKTNNEAPLSVRVFSTQQHCREKDAQD